MTTFALQIGKCPKRVQLDNLDMTSVGVCPTVQIYIPIGDIYQWTVKTHFGWDVEK